jgi:hypothetical protein
MADEEPRHYDLEPGEESPPNEQEGELLHDAGDTCPNCGTPLARGEVLCMKCGYDLEANVVRKPKVTEEEGPGDEPEEPDLFVEPGRGSPKVLAVAGGIITVAAMILAGVNTTVSGAAIAAAVVLPLYEVLLHTASGVLALFIVSKLVEERFGDPELAAARILVAFALFQLFMAMVIPVPVVGAVLKTVLGLGAYWVAVWWLFRKTPAVTLLIMAAHIALWAFVWIGKVLYEAATPAVAAGGP